MQTDKPTNLRDKLIEKIGAEKARIDTDLKNHHAEVMRLRAVARQHSDRGDTPATHQAMAEANTHSQAIMAKDARLKQLELDRMAVISGNHPELAGEAIAAAARAGTAQQAELDASEAEFKALLTPELEAAAQKYINAITAMRFQVPRNDLAELIVTTAKKAA